MPRQDNLKLLDSDPMQEAVRLPVATLQVKTLEPVDHDRWNAFVHGCPEATFFHLAEWRDVIEQAFKHRTYFLYVEADGDIHGILPLAQVNSRLFGNALISTPFCVYGGAVANTEIARQTLEQAACKLADQLQVDYLELRNLSPQHPSWPTKDIYVTFRKTIDPEPKNNLLNIPRKQRAMVRKGMRAGLISEIVPDVDRFYAVYSESVRNLGTPVFSRNYVRLLKAKFGDRCEVLTITKDRQVMASVLSFYFRDQVLPYYGGSTTTGHALAGTNDFMYWELMRRACARGYRTFDYGRSKFETGCYHFKKNWGFEPEPLYYEYYLVKAERMPEVKNPLNPKYQRYIRLWQHLPLGLSRFLGPYLARDLG